MNLNKNAYYQLNKWLTVSDLLILGLYGIFCLYFYLERTSFLDNPFTLFKLINDEWLFVNANRYPAAIMQFLPLLLIKLSAPLKIVMLGCSMGYFLFHAGIFYLIRFYLKDKAISWLLLATLIIPVAHTFFWNNNELFLGLSSICLWLALMRQNILSSSIVVAVLLPWFHPLLILLALLIFVCSLLTKDINWKLLLPNFMLFLTSYFIKSYGFPNYYDTGKQELLLKNLANYKLDLSSLFEQIGHFHFWPICLCCVLCLGVLIFHRKWLLSLFLTGFILGYLLLTDLTETNKLFVFYNEGNFLVLFFAAAYVFVIAKLSSKYRWVYFVLAFLFILGFVRIAVQSQFYTQRISWYKGLTQQHDRMILTYGEQTKKQLIQAWASPFESIVISTLYGPSKTLIFSDNPSALDDIEIDQNTQMITTHGRFLIYNRDNQYFKLNDKTYKTGHLD